MLIQNVERSYLKWLLVLSATLYTVAIFLPMFTFTKFIVAKNTFSVVSGIVELIEDGNIILFILIAAFSVLLPFLKLGLLFKILNNYETRSDRIEYYLHLMHEYGHWAMLDVLVVAILVVTVKLGIIASIEVHFGLYLFTFSILLIMFITNKVKKLTNKNRP